ncbi:MAG: CoA ester lyase [Magnetococcales bacterium]|nr:CoA ester lyase [Magnetococcales bacterium]
MILDNRLLRSALYVPASQEKVMEKAPTLGADVLIFDLEDSVPPHGKAEARLQAQKKLGQCPEEAFWTVRINSLETNLWQEDITTIFPGHPGSVVVPKIDRVESLAPLDDWLGELEKAEGKGVVTPIWAMIESPLGVLNAFAIASHPRVSCLVLGTSDLTSALGVPVLVERDHFSLALQQTVLAARAAGVPVIDGVFVDLKDAAGFERQCREGARLGFDGKTVIHPSQISPANQLFLPSDIEVSKAEKILSSWRLAHSRGEEICVVDGQLVERLHARRAIDILRRVGRISEDSTV